MFGACSSLITLPNISKWNIQKINNLNSIFKDCSLLTYIPIFGWKLNNKVKIDNIFKGCNSLLIIPDISKWNAAPKEFSDVSYSSFNSMKKIKSDSISLDNYSEDIFSKKDNKDNIDNQYNEDNSDSGDYYDNFYN